jgi:glucose-1-phosphatase
MLKNIIFDLGDVIIPIDMTAPIRNFAMLANLPEADVNALWKQHDFLGRYETGFLDDAGFRQHVRQLLTQHGPQTAVNEWADEVIDTAWNTILLDLPVERIDRLLGLRADYRIFLLSNTSPIHIRQVNRMLTGLHRPTLEEIFERVFYSYAVGLAKPSPDIYRHVLDTAGLRADETAFLDDNPANVSAAAALGIRAVQVMPPQTMLTYLDELLA